MFHNIHLTTLAVAFCLVVTSMPVHADPGGGDASGDWRSALTLTPGVYEGEMGGSDSEDWYRLVAAPGKYIRVEIDFVGNPHVHLEALSDDGRYIFSRHVSSWPQVHEFSGPASRIGLDSWTSASSNYTLTFTEMDAPDVMPRAIRVAPVMVESDAGPVGTGALRDIEVDLANVGPGAGSGVLRVSTRTVTDGTVTTIKEVPVQMVASEERTVTVRWNALETGIVGDVEVIATAVFTHDADRGNDVMRTTHYSVIGGTGVGVTGATSTGKCAGFVAYACVGAGVSPRSTGAGQSFRALIPYQSAYAFAGTDGVRAGAGAGAIVGVGVAAGHNIGAGGYAAACAVLTCQFIGLP